MTSRHLPAKHYLRIYRTKLALAENGTTRPAPEFVSFMKGFVEGLEALDPEALVRLEALPGKARYTDASTGALIGEIELRHV